MRAARATRLEIVAGQASMIVLQLMVRFIEEHRDGYSVEPICGYQVGERGVEEVLIGGVVERYRKSIQTQQISRLVAITEQDCEELERGMTKCSRWLHDQAAAEQVAVPEPDELSTDIEALATWRSSINSRR